MSAEEFKAQGNQAAKEGRLADAIDCYTKAINIDGSNHVYYSNRANIYHQLEDYDAAIADAEKCIELKPSFGKGFLRKADALVATGKREEAMEVLRDGIESCGNTEPLLSQRLSSLESSTSSFGGAPGARDPGAFMRNMFNAEGMAKIRANPKTAKYLAEDPSLEQKLAMVASNPQMMMQVAGSDPRLMECMLVAMGIDPDMMKDMPQAHDAPTSFETTHAQPAEPPAPKEPEKVLTPEEIEANKLKEEGNDLFKAKKYDEAIEKYEAAFAKHKSILFLNNISTALLKMDKIDEAEKKALEAYDYGRENPGTASFEELGKALTKAASAQYARKEYEKAIKTLKSAMLEHRSKQTLALLTKIEDEWELIKKQNAYSPEKAERAKNEGNELFKAGKYQEAVDKYTEGLKALPLDPEREYKEDNEKFTSNKTILTSLLNNRANAYFKLGQMNLAYDDADHVVSLIKDTTNVKALLRKAQIERLRRQYYKAVETYKKVLEQEKYSNQEAMEGYRKTMEKIQELQRNPDSKEAKEVTEIAMADEEIQKIASDPGLAEVIKQISTNQQAAQQYLSDPNISSRIEKLINAGIIRTGH